MATAFSFSTKKKPQDIYANGGFTGYQAPKVNYSASMPKASPTTVRPMSVGTSQPQQPKWDFSKPTNTQDTKTQPSAFDSYMKTFGNYQSTLDSNLNRDTTFAQKRADTFTKQQGELYDIQNSGLQEGLKSAEKMSKGARDTYYKNLALTKEGANIAKDDVRTQADETLLSQAQNKRQVDAQRQRKFASLNTIDSGGSQGFTGQQENADTQFLNNQAKTQELRDRDLKTIDLEIVKAEIDTKSLVDQEVTKFQDYARQVQQSVQLNDVQKRQMLENAYLELEGTLNGLVDNYNTNVSTLEGKKLELAKTIAEGQNKAGKEVYANEDALRGEFLKQAKETGFLEVATQYEKILNTPDSAAGDLSLIFSYMKMLDPTSTVREGEYANAQNATGVPAQLLNTYNKVIQGNRLNEAQREDFRNNAGVVFNSAKGNFDNISKFYSGQAQNRGLNTNNITGVYGGVNPQQRTAGSQVTMTSPNGQTFTVDQSEVQEAIQNGWRAN